MCPLAYSHPPQPPHYFLSFFFLSRTGNVAVDLHRASAPCCSQFLRCPTRFKVGFSLPTSLTPSSLVPPPPHPTPNPSPVSSVKCVSHAGKLAKHYKFTLKESLPTAGRVRECLQTSVKPTTFFSSVSLSPFDPFFFFKKKKDAISRLTTGGAGGGSSLRKSSTRNLRRRRNKFSTYHLSY